MRPPVNAIKTAGQGADLVLIHGTASVADGWTPLIRLLARRVRMTMYHRRGTPGWPVTTDQIPTSVSEHAEDLADLVRTLDPPVHCFGVSLGATIVLELCRTHPELIRSAALFEPPLAGDNVASRLASALLPQFDRLVREGKPEDASERFHRRVLGDQVWERLPADAKERARRLWPHIHGDLRAQVTYRVQCDDLRKVDVPVALLRGALTGGVFDDTIKALTDALPRSQNAGRRNTLPHGCEV